MPQKAIIFDIDGTLANCDHRLHHLSPKKDFDAFYAAMSDDTLYQPIFTLYNILAQYSLDGGGNSPTSLAIILCSGRPENYREATEAWLHRHGIDYYNALYMRPAGDFRRDDIIKSELLDRIIATGYDPILAIDDRRRVVDMWRSRGITCLQCREWSEADPRQGTDEASQARGTLTMMVGPVCGGKTNMAGRMAATALYCDFRVSTDKIRQELVKNYEDQSQNTQVYRACHAMIAARVQNGLHCLYDATNLRRKDRLAVVALAKGGPVRYIVCDRPLEDKIASAKERMTIQGSKTDWVAVVAQYHERMGSCIRDILKGDNLPNVTVADMRGTQ